MEQEATTPPLKAVMSVLMSLPARELAEFRNPCTTAGSTPGSVIAAPIRTTASMARVKMTR